MLLMNWKIGFIGGGNMAGAIIAGILNRGQVQPGSITVSDPEACRLKAFERLGVGVMSDNRALANASNLLFLAVKPQMYEEILSELGDCTAGKFVVSIAPGISTGYLRRRLPGAAVIRVMPNTPMLVGKGATAIAAADGLSDEGFQFVKDIFSSAGNVEVIPESQMDDIVAVSGSSPAYFFRLADAVVSEAKSAGIDPAVALRLIAHTMEGSARMLLSGEKSASELTNQVCSPGGTTLAALSAFDEMGFDNLIAEAMRRCTKRSLELSR